MALRRAKNVIFRPRSLSDTVDATNAHPGSMESLQNLIHNPGTAGTFVPRPASIKLTDFTGVTTTPGTVSVLFTVGNFAYGMIAALSGPNTGKDVPFVYHFTDATFHPVTIAGTLPVTQPTTGEWVPLTMAQIGARVVVTSPGYPGGSDAYFGWIDVSNFTDTTHTGSTHTSTLIDTLSANVLQAGWNVGMTISGAGIPANTTIVAIAANGLSLILSQAATATAAGVALSVAGGTTAAPLYAAGNTDINPLISVPAAVEIFNGRAWYAVRNGVVFSDAGNATLVTNATQAILFQNGITVTALAGMPLSSPVSGGIIQSLMCFQGDSIIQQITGDQSTSNLADNPLNVTVGTLSPNSIVTTPLGLAFVAPDGLRMIGFDAQVSPPIGADGQGVLLPFINAITPSRTNSCFNQNVLRISVKNALQGEMWQEYWFDFTRKAWSGPHTFPSALMQPTQTATTDSFIMAPIGIPATLWLSDSLPTVSTTYVENGSVMNWIYETSLWPDNEQMAMNNLAELNVALDVGKSTTITLSVIDEIGTTLDTEIFTGSGQTSAIWGVFRWGVDKWGSASNFAQAPVSFQEPIVFKQMVVKINGQSVADLVVGNLYMKHQILGYSFEPPL